jgi:hypothetical protein
MRIKTRLPLPVGHQKLITDENYAVGALSFYLLLTGWPALRSNHGYPCRVVVAGNP